ncbi:MAG: hypothetical protein B9S32_11070 [Verrucomicrobia bacterium Tous-C9LFEB]|nr:MAG: hypothetical protein B9S32_11070 [Verrucomicrobia bacterium Tous-C9LFEB]
MLSAMANKRLPAKPSRKRKPSSGGGGGSSFDLSVVLIGAFVVLLLGAILWYVWPRPGPSTAERENQKRLKQLTTQHPDAEVFDLGGGEKKK